MISFPLWLFMVALSGRFTALHTLPTSTVPASTASTVPASTGCSTSTQVVQQAAADIVFLLDGSRSVSPDQFLIMKTFVKNVTRSLLPYNTLFAFAQYSSELTKHVNFNQYNKRTFESQVNSIVQSRGGTYTARAIKKVVQEMFDSSVGARAGAKRFLIVITDGLTSDSASYTSVAAQADASNITRYAIGVGGAWSSQSSQNELKSIASKPDSEHVFPVTNFEGLTHIRESLEKKILTIQGHPCFKGPSSTVPASTVPSSTVSTVPSSTVPAFTVPASAVPSSTASAVPSSAASTASAVPSSTASAVPASTASAVPSSAASTASAVPASAVPASTASAVPASTASAVPASAVPSSTASAVPASTASAVPASTFSTVPASTASAVPSSTASAVPSSAASAVPASTASAVPTSTASAVPSSTASAVPASTASAVPSSTASAVPTSTASAVPASTASAVPASTASAVPASAVPASTGCSTSTQVVQGNQTCLPTSSNLLTTTQVPADIVFLLDGSTSVKADQFILMKEFVKNVTRSLLPYDTLFAFAQYSDQMTIHVNFNQFNRTGFEKQVDSMIQRQGGTNPGYGVGKVVKYIFNSFAGARPGAKRILITIIDGEIHNTSEYPSVTAEADGQKITRYAIVVGTAWTSQMARNQLNAIASKPESDHVFKVDNFDALNNISKALENKLLNIQGPSHRSSPTMTAGERLAL
ncbi:mucin-5AC-like isoform X3 [Alosa sapidissima]|uniref:mucin-5AC-like isoform X3 n=1 Tax=Alosa sapidissima TaxID=34773 RepID=UPI001C08EED6|nr:mucin-5AC-like isoform X3 [Alosa sapidissima]